jgi:hypothetical protein
MSEFEHWLECGLNQRNTDSEIAAGDLVKYFIRFNRDIGAISQNRTDSRMARSIWHLYGSGSCYLAELSRLSPSPDLSEFFDSIPHLYSDLFEVRCSRFFSHLDRGIERANPLNAPCYMLWDMDGGLDSFQFSGGASQIDHSIRLLERLAASEHPATIESAIHGLGHMIDDFRDRCQPVLERIILKSEVPIELRDYASNAIHHYIQ